MGHFSEVMKQNRFSEKTLNDAYVALRLLVLLIGRLVAWGGR